MKHSTKVFGLTGNIGTGKSTVAWIFGELGIPVLDADEIAHEVIAPKSTACKALYERYGGKIFIEDDVIDRKALASIAFSDPSERKFIESIIHPHVKEIIERRVAKLAREGEAFVIVEVPLLFEAGWEKEFDAVIVVNCDMEKEIERCREKFGFTRKEVMARLVSQYPIEKKIKLADHVIDNNGTIEEARVQVQRLHKDMVTGKFPAH